MPHLQQYFPGIIHNRKNFKIYSLIPIPHSLNKKYRFQFPSVKAVKYSPYLLPCYDHVSLQYESSIMSITFINHYLNIQLKSLYSLPLRNKIAKENSNQVKTKK